MFNVISLIILSAFGVLISPIISINRELAYSMEKEICLLFADIV
jgi:hypothetical protein